MTINITNVYINTYSNVNSIKINTTNVYINTFSNVNSIKSKPNVSFVVLFKI